MPRSEAAKPHVHIDQQQAAPKYHQNHQRPPEPSYYYYYYYYLKNNMTEHYAKIKYINTTQTKINYNKISQSIGKGREAPSVMPKHLHFVRDPCTQRRVARRIAKVKRARIQFITKLKGPSHLILRKSHK